MKLLSVAIGSLTLLVFLNLPAAAANQKDAFQALQARERSAFNMESRRMAKDWDALEKKQRQEWAELRRQIEQKWQTVALPSKKEWVDYDSRFESRSKVDFAKGNIQIESIVAQSESVDTEKAFSKIISRIKNIFSKIVAGGVNLLDGQVKNSKGEEVTPKNLDEFIEHEIVPQIKTKEAYRAADGVNRQEFSVSFKLVPEHLNLRAEKYKPLVLQAARKLELDPRVLMAIIHTESAFNPMAVSQDGAVGLMQVIPRYAGREAYKFIYGDDWLILPAYLAAPGINIELGSTYYSLLNSRYFGKFEPLKKRYLSICAYNWGPTAVKKNIINKYNITQMSDISLYKLLEANSPQETSDYLEKVERRISLYDEYF